MAGGHVWWGGLGMCDRGCAWERGVHEKAGMCGGGHVWWGHAWQGACMAGGMHDRWHV